MTCSIDGAHLFEFVEIALYSILLFVHLARLVCVDEVGRHWCSGTGTIMQ